MFFDNRKDAKTQRILCASASPWFKKNFGTLLILLITYSAFSQTKDLYITQFNVEHGLSQSTVYRVLQDHSGLIWIVTGGGLQYFDGSSFRSFDAPELPGLGNVMHEMTEIQPGKLLISSGPYLLHFDCHTGEFKVVEDGHYESKPPSRQELFFADRSHNYWLTDKSRKHVFRITGGKMTEIRFISPEGRHMDTIRPAIRSIYEDNSGNLWFCTDGNGLLFYSPRQLIFGLKLIGFTRCMAEYKGDIIAGTFKNGLWRLSPDLNVSERVNTGSSDQETYYYDLYTDDLERLWAATSEGVHVYNESGKVVFHFPLKTSAGKFLQLPGNRLVLSAYGELWECSTGKQPKLTFIRKQTQIRFIKGIGSSYWVGSHFGLYRKDTVNGYLKAISFLEEDNLTRVPVYCILSKGNRIWAGTEHGLEWYSTEGIKQVLPPVLEELKHEIIYSLIPDSQGRTWFAGNHGTGCITAENDRIIRFNAKNNLQSSEFNSNACLASSDGMIWFGGINGVNAIDPSVFTVTSRHPGIRLVTLSVSDTSCTQGIPNEGETYRIRWDASHISGTVFNSGYLTAGTISYSFFLEGYDAGWSRPSADPHFSYRNLPPGQYILKARCIDSYSNEGEAKVLATIIIRTPFWKTWTFMTLSSLLLIILMILVIRKIQETRNRARIRELEHRSAIDRERLRIAQDMHDEIGASLTHISILSEVIKREKDNTTEMMKLIDRISGISGRVVDDIGEIIWAMNPKNDNLSSFVSYLREHASEFLDSAGINSELHFPESCPAVSMSSEQRRNIYLVVKEALNNVVKHSAARNVRIILEYDKGVIRISITDDGKGFITADSGSKGYGLAGMRKRITDLNGEFIIESDLKKGTCIRFLVKI